RNRPPGRPGPSPAGRTLAQVLHDRGHRAGGAGPPRLADGGGRDGRCSRRRAHRPGAPGRGDGLGRPRGRRRPGGGAHYTVEATLEGRLNPSMSWLTELLQRPPITWTDLLDIAIVSI